VSPFRARGIDARKRSLIARAEGFANRDVASSRVAVCGCCVVALKIVHLREYHPDRNELPLYRVEELRLRRPLEMQLQVLESGDGLTLERFYVESFRFPLFRPYTRSVLSRLRRY
jgi:hypothetical protein